FARPEATVACCAAGSRRGRPGLDIMPPKSCEIAPMKTERRAAAKLAAPTINLASVVYGLDTYMRSRGADAGDALRGAGLEPSDLIDPDRRVPLIRYLELLEICAGALDDPQFGLKFGAQYKLRHAGVVGNATLASRTVGEAFRTMG